MMQEGESDPLLGEGRNRDHNSISDTPENPNAQQNDEGNTTCQKLINAVKALKNVTIEPIIFLNILAWSMQSIVSTNLLLDKVCFNELKYGSEVCNNLSSYPEMQIEVQTRVTKINLYNDLLTNIPSVFFVLFLGSWSDKHGRKLPLVLPLIGSLLSSLIYLINTYMFSLPAMYILFAGVPRALSGGFTTLLMACYAYISDITKIKSRTMRIALMDFGMFLGFPLGLLSSSYILSSLGYFGVYGISAGIFVIAIIYTVARVEDTRGRFSRYHLETTDLTTTTSHMFRDLFDVENIKKSVAVCFKPRPNKKRTKILMLMSAMCSMVFVFGTTNVGYLYVKRKFGWTYNQYVNLSMVDVAVNTVANSIALPLLSYRLQVDDAILGLVGTISQIGSLIVKGLAPQPWYLYLSVCVGLLAGLPMVIIRSMMSKIIPQDELGMIFSMLASWESILPLVSHPLCTVVYNATIEDFPGTVYLMSTAFVFIGTVIFVWLIANRRTATSGPHVHQEEFIQSVET